MSWLPYTFLGYFLTFGGVCFADGVWQTKRGRPNPALKAIMLALFFVFMTVGVIISYLRWRRGARLPDGRRPTTHFTSHATSYGRLFWLPFPTEKRIREEQTQ